MPEMASFSTKLRRAACGPRQRCHGPLHFSAGTGRIEPMVRLVISALVLLGIALGVVPARADVSGRATVTDGDTLKIDDQRIRLHGIDAPESKQVCKLQGVDWACGKQASQELRNLTRGRAIICEERDRDRYGRTVAVCFDGTRDLNKAMVLSGMALAYRRYSLDDVEEERAAKTAGNGLWAGRFVPPWEWRRGKRLDAVAADGRKGCRIKGNIGRGGKRIYHVPGGRWYDQTKIDRSKGECWFCSEGEAQDAGWRRSAQ